MLTENKEKISTSLAVPQTITAKCGDDCRSDPGCSQATKSGDCDKHIQEIQFRAIQNLITDCVNKILSFMNGPLVPQNDGERELFKDIPLPDKTPKRPSLERSATFSVKAEKKTEQSLDSLVNAVLATSKYKPQSGEEVGQSISTADDNIESEVVQFSDENPGHALVVDSTYDSTMDVSADSKVSLAGYLSRPVQIFDVNWSHNATLGTTFNPWTLWSGNRWVRAKLANYALMRCKLHVKFLINGTPFHYGKVLVSYDPLHNFNNLSITPPYSSLEMVHLSQKPHLYLDPQKAEGGSMVLPFFWTANYFNLPQGDMGSIGQFHLSSFGNLLSASSGTNDVTISVYAWAEDLELAMPTSQYLPQSGTEKKGAMNSGDEYGRGVISQPASAIAKAAGQLENMPVIGPYARATNMVASGVGSVAALFGFSRPTIIADRQTYAPDHVGGLANVNSSDTSNKLSLDVKQEITIDSRTVGLDGTDQMTAASILERESYYTSVSWAETSVPDTLLWNVRVGPDNAVAGANNRYAMTPAALWSQQFRYWHGTIKYRFQVVKSRHHRGRLLFRWDPRLLSNTVEPNAVYSRVVDIEEEDDFEIEIGWGQADPFRRTGTIGSNTNNAGTTLIGSVDGTLYNGVLDIRVLNRLVSPDGDSPVQILVSVSMTPDAKFGAPQGGRLANLTPFLPQSGFVPQSGSALSTASPTGASSISSIGSPSVGADHTMSVFMGETVTSLRELLKRYYLTRTIARTLISVSSIGFNRFICTALPYTGGADNNGLDLLRGSSRNRGTVATNGPIQIWNLCYAGWRGSLRHKFIISDDVSGPVRATRLPGPIRAYGYNTDTIPINSSINDRTKWLSSANASNTFNGSYVTDAEHRKTIEIEVPFYSRFRFNNSRVFRANRLTGDGIEITDVVNIDGKGSLGHMDDYVAAGDDYTLFFFTGVPLLYVDYVSAQTEPDSSTANARRGTGPRTPLSLVWPLTAPSGAAGAAPLPSVDEGSDVESVPDDEEGATGQ